MGCCPANSWPALKVDYEPKGKRINHNGTQIYRIGSGKKSIIMLGDIFGAWSGRNQHVADIYAELGYNVYLPQVLPKLFEGDITNFQDIIAYVTSLDQKIVDKRFQDTVSLVENQGNKRYFAAGFCWGVWKFFSIATKTDKIIAMAAFHPSVMVENLLGGDQIQLSKKVKCPTFLYPAGNDKPEVKPQGEITKILVQKFGADKAGSFQFPQMVHGWVVRGDLNIENVKRDTYIGLGKSHEYFQLFQV